MKKLLVFAVFALLILPTILAIDVTIEKLNTSMDTIIKGLDEPAVIDLNITNNGDHGEFLFYNLLGFEMQPKDTIAINKSGSDKVQLTIYPRKDFDITNYFSMQYFVKDELDNSHQEEKMVLKIVELENAFEVGSGEIDPESNTIEIYIHNKEKFNFKGLNVKFSSKFFELEKTLDLDANQRQDYTIELNKEDYEKLTAGFYTLTADISIEELTAEVEGLIKFSEKNIVETTEKQFGLIVSTNIFKKTNEGNTVSPSDTIIEKNIISRLFTSFEPMPDSVKREGLKITYAWNQQIKPGETLEIVVKTNWLYPFLIIILIAIIVVSVKKYSTTDVQVRKRVSFVKAKGGEFALKVTLNVYSSKYVERVNVVDRLPSLMKVYERFGSEKPSRVNEKARMIEWDFEKLEAGEIRTLSYIIYSKSVGVMGKFALPAATAIYQRLGKIKESMSNKAFFMAEQKSARDVEYY